MNLFVHLVLRLAGVVLVCLACAVGWVLIDTHRAIEKEASASADRVANALETLYWRELLWRGGLSREHLVPIPDWETMATMKVISPGVCITVTPGNEAPRRLCSQLETISDPAPAWFQAFYDHVFGAYARVERPLTARQPMAGVVAAEPDRGAAVRQAWQRTDVVLSVAALLAAGIGVLAAAVIGQSLMPARTIVAGLRRLERGDYSYRLPGYRTAEFDRISRAVNDLTSRLAETTAQRMALTNRLFQVQEEERRALARDLHDEFGQCLAAVGALATVIELEAADRPDLAKDARSIRETSKRMTATLRGALARLRSQEVEELGLEASLAQLVAGWNAQKDRQAAFHLDIVGNLAGLPEATSLSIYRIAQECLTNAARHGKPRDVRLQVQRVDAEGRDAVAVSVEDDGGGTLSRLGWAPGYGILGIRERVTALGGSLSISQARWGVRVAALIPLMPAREASAPA
ncbi:signal transduction histidine kinase [Inquilinus ginsengisoli]|uniref:Signal transduction histidine kinase n=1 Tax=Inquilinus ginsengisoli TaxID=363840 RepID=A0ABU1JMN9_9PROT|nr:histidine kinase [Inquilinus ginsengisoli]MDR6289886.1 signal transduction histidine kinase [Inquilinus ginsengisoli]